VAKLVLIGVFVGVVVFFLMRSLSKQKSKGGSSLRLWAKLHSLTHDRELADRLVAGEMKRNPELSELQCVKRAIAQIQCDRGR
jgi:hypothetical protein